MHVFAGFVDNFFGHFRPEIRYGVLPRVSRNSYKLLPIYLSSILTQNFRPATSSGHLQSDEIPDSKITHRYTAANQVHAPDTTLQSVVEDMKTIF